MEGKLAFEADLTQGIHLCIGSMFAGKTEWLIDYAGACAMAGVVYCAIKPAMDKRYSDSMIVSHNGMSIEAHPLENLQDALRVVGDAEVVLIDEGQFFIDLVQGCLRLANAGKHVLVAALAATAEQRPWPAVSDLIAHADKITHKCAAICAVCRANKAPHTRVRPQTAPSKTGETIRIGGSDIYEPVCRECLYRVKDQ